MAAAARAFMGLRTPIYLALACLFPMAPMVLTIMPLAEIVKWVVKALF
jgi:hypothetical protein